MIVNKQIKLIVVLVAAVLVGVGLLSQYGKRTERATGEIPVSFDSITNVIEKVQETLMSSNAASTVVADTPCTVKLASVAMVPPPVREEVDATAKPKTLPRGEDSIFREVSAFSGQNRWRGFVH